MFICTIRTEEQYLKDIPVSWSMLTAAAPNPSLNFVEGNAIIHGGGQYDTSSWSLHRGLTGTGSGYCSVANTTIVDLEIQFHNFQLIKGIQFTVPQIQYPPHTVAVWLMNPQNTAWRNPWNFSVSRPVPSTSFVYAYMFNSECQKSKSIWLRLTCSPATYIEFANFHFYRRQV